MSTENINNTNKENQMILNTSKVFAKNLTSRVDINVLIARVRKEQSAENIKKTLNRNRDFRHITNKVGKEKFLGLRSVQKHVLK